MLKKQNPAWCAPEKSDDWQQSAETPEAPAPIQKKVNRGKASSPEEGKESKD